MGVCRRPNNVVAGVTNNIAGCNRTENILDRLCCDLGKRVNCQFAVGQDGDLEDRNGILDEIGGNYIVLRSPETGNRLYCNVCNLQFLTVYNNCR